MSSFPAQSAPQLLLSRQKPLAKKLTIRGVSEAFEVLDLGKLPYSQAWEIQKQHHNRVATGGQPILLLVEHPPVLTLGRKAREGENIVATREFLRQHGIEVFEVERGGDVTYHGEGQLVAYPIFPVGRRVRDFLRLLEQAVIQTLQQQGLADARPNPDYAGVYVAERLSNGGPELQQKICSIGVAVKQNVALHGLALNVTTNLQHFELIVPCGLTDTQMTSLQREYDLRGIASRAEMQQVKKALVNAFEQVFVNYDWSLPSSAPVI